MPSWTDQVQAVSSMAGIVIAIAGSLFIAYQIRQISQTSRAGAHTAIFSHFLELAQLMLDKPEIRPYLCDGKDVIREDPLYDQVILACEMFSDFYEHVSLQRENLPEQSKACWDKAIAYRYQRNSALRNYLEEHKALYVSDLFSSIERGKKKLLEEN